MKIGGWFKDCDKIQKSVRRDPNPGVPFCDAELPMVKFDTALTIAAMVIVVCFIIAIWVF